MTRLVAPTRPQRVLLAVAVAWLFSSAAAHATLVIGTLTFEPDPPGASDSLSVTIDLEDPGLVEVEDAVIFLELRPLTGSALDENEQPSGEALLITDRVPEIAPGTYRISIPTPDPARYTLSVRDRTYRQEEAVANLSVDIGEEPLGEIVFVLPPTDIGPASLGSWLLWLIAVPLLAGVIVTVLVLRGGKDEDDESEEDNDDAGGTGTAAD